MIDEQGNLEGKMSTFQRIVPSLTDVHSDSTNLGDMISFTSDLAENVSGKVRILDLAKSRVQAAKHRVNDVLDLKFCTDGVQTALQSEDFEKAAAHIHRFLSLDEKVLKQFAPETKESGGLDASLQVLREAEKRLQTLVHEKFDEAVGTSDLASVERFFKIFPLIGLKDEGLAKFSSYLKTQIANKSTEHIEVGLSKSTTDRRAKVMFVDTLTLLFEEIARIVEIHQPLVETFYGPGRMLHLMMDLQEECDKQAKIIVDNFVKHRDFHSKSKLVMQAFRTNYKASNPAERLDPMELDVMLAESTLLNARTELYLRFVRRRVMADIDISDVDEAQKQEHTSDLEKMVLTCQLSCCMQEIIGSYILMEEYFMKETVNKAVSMDTLESESQTSSMVDDVFFILKKCTKRAISSGSVDCACAMVNHTASLLESNYRDVLYSKLRAGFPSGSFDVTQAYNLLQQGKFPTSSSDTDAAKLEFLTTLNNIEVSLEYTHALKKSITEECESLISKGAGEVGRAKLESCIADLAQLNHKFKDVLDYGLSQLNTSAIKPRIKPWVDTYQSVSHSITEEEFSNYEANDPFIQEFMINLETLLLTFKESLTSSNYDALVSLLTTAVTAQLEKTVLKMTFNRLGGLQFDKELRSLIGYLTSVTQWTIRDKFARLSQMATLLNLERVTEVMDYWGTNSGPLTWRLTPTEVRQVLSLRNDFRHEDIKRLKL
ncbi:conserved oligomeric Golgi complex subunit 4-like [Antedon mediterranea]|uniref:conserved oligomeric Golgi complex subunit 4-like n=1 Tax=Antedon mediterranea TaxID=105859 RepID=UPI003AF40F79